MTMLDSRVVGARLRNEIANRLEDYLIAHGETLGSFLKGVVLGDIEVRWEETEHGEIPEDIEGDLLNIIEFGCGSWGEFIRSVYRALYERKMDYQKRKILIPGGEAGAKYRELEKVCKRKKIKVESALQKSIDMVVRGEV